MKTTSISDKRVFTKAIGKTASWSVTKEASGLFVWRGVCLDSQPWEESDWEWEVKRIFYSFQNSDAIEFCLLSALKEQEQAQ